MKRLLALVFAIVGFSALPSAPAHADDYGKVTSWTGLYLGAGLGWSVADTEISVPGFSVVNGLSARGWTGDARLGGDWQVPNTWFVLGAFVGYNFGEAEFGAFNDAFTATIDPQWNVGARLGIALPTKTLLYIGGGLQHAKAEASIKGPGTIWSQTDNGRMWVGGIEQQLAPYWTIALEYSLTEYHFNAGSVSIDPDVSAFKLRMNLRTN